MKGDWASTERNLKDSVDTFLFGVRFCNFWVSKISRRATTFSRIS